MEPWPHSALPAATPTKVPASSWMSRPVGLEGPLVPSKLRRLVKPVPSRLIE